MLVMNKKNETKTRSNFELVNPSRPEEGIKRPPCLDNFFTPQEGYSTFYYPVSRTAADHAIRRFPKSLTAVPYITPLPDHDSEKVLLIIKLLKADELRFFNWIRVSSCFLF